MSEKPEELAITLSSSPNLATKNSRNLTQTIALIEELLAQSDSPNEALDWARVREVILRQNEEVKEENHRRFLEKSQFIYKISFSGAAFVVGIVLFICGYKDAVYLIGAGLIPIVSMKKPT
jgi:ABC-type transport system involved in Fe-S cluster assembly fused permease/ATPase subunit